MLHSTFTEWVLQNGINQQTLELLVSITIVATIVSIFRYIFGTKSYGIYAPIILAISYSYTGLRYGLAVTILVILTTLASHTILKKIRMHYITRIAINYCILAISLILFIVLIHNFGLGLQNISQIPPLALISIATLSDFFIKQYIQKSVKITFSTLAGTILVATIGWFVITRDTVSEYIVNNLWIIPLLVVANTLIGQFKELRIKEIIRFNSIINEKEDAK